MSLSGNFVLPTPPVCVFTVSEEASTLTLLHHSDPTALTTNLQLAHLKKSGPLSLASSKIGEILLPLPLPPNWHSKLLHYTHSGGYHNSRPLSSDYIKKIKVGMGVYPCKIQPISLHWPHSDDRDSLTTLYNHAQESVFNPTDLYSDLLDLVLHPTLPQSLENAHELKIIPMEGQHTLKILQDYSHDFYEFCSVQKSSPQQIFHCTEDSFPYDKITDILLTLIESPKLFAGLPTHMKEVCNLFAKNEHVHFILYSQLPEETRTKIINLSNQTFTHFANSFLTFAATARQYLLTLLPEYNHSTTDINRQELASSDISSAESLDDIPDEALSLVHPTLHTVPDGWYFYSLLVYRTHARKPQGYYAVAPHQHLILQLQSWVQTQLPSYKLSQTISRERFSNISEFFHILLSSEEVFELIKQLWSQDNSLTVGTFKFSRGLSHSAHRSVLVQALASDSPKKTYITACKLYTTLNTFCTELWVRYTNSSKHSEASRVLLSPQEFCEHFGFPPLTHTSSHTDKKTGKKKVVVDLTPTQHLTQLLRPISTEFYDQRQKSKSTASLLEYPFNTTTQHILSLCTKVHLTLNKSADLLSQALDRPGATLTAVDNLKTPSDQALYKKVQSSAKTLKHSLKHSDMKLKSPEFQPTPSRSIHATILQPLSKQTVDNHLTPLLGNLHTNSISFTLIFDLEQLSSNFNLKKFDETLLSVILTKAFSLSYHDSPPQTVLIAGDSHHLSKVQHAISASEHSSTYASQLLHFGRNSPKALLQKPPPGKLATPSTVTALLLAQSNDQKFLSSFHSTLPILDFVSCKVDIPPLPLGESQAALPPPTSHSFQPWMLALLYKYKSSSPPNIVVISFNKPRLAWAAAHLFTSSVSFLEEASHAGALSAALSSLKHAPDPPKTWTTRLAHSKGREAQLTTELLDDDTTLTQVAKTTAAVPMVE